MAVQTDKLVTYKDEFGNERKMRNIILPWGQVREQVRAVVEHGEEWTTQPSGERLRSLHTDPFSREVWSAGEREHYFDDKMQKWRWRHGKPQYLASGDEMKTWFRDGFRTDAFENLAERVPAALAHRPSWNEEEGDIDISRLYGGFDDFYMGPVERPTKPGVRVQIEMAFACGVKQKTIEEYGAWVNSLLGSMEAYGIDMVVDLWIPLDDLFNGDRGIRTNVLVRVKNANEVSDFTEWSILFSPAGYRQVGFAAKCVAGDKIGKRVTYSYGMTIGGKTWGLEYDKENATVRITVNQRAGGSEAVPFDKLTKMAIDAELIPNPDEQND